MIIPTHWRIYTTQKVSSYHFNSIEELFEGYVRVKQYENPHCIICYDCSYDEVRDIGDRLHQNGYDVISIQSGVGAIP